MPINLTLKTSKQKIAFNTHKRDGARNNALQANFFLNLQFIGYWRTDRSHEHRGQATAAGSLATSEVSATEGRHQQQTCQGQATSAVPYLKIYKIMQNF
jgi:hypothetical protein